MVINIGNNEFNVKTVFLKKDISKGMMGKDFDGSFDGMLFLMTPGDHAFWMKNCIVSLDIIFIDQMEITNIHHNCPPCDSEDCPNYFGSGDLVLELPGGTCEELGINEGDLISF